MAGVAPADQERDQAAGQRVESHLPAQHRSGGLRPLPIGYRAWVIAVASCPGGGRVDVAAGQRPASQAAAAYAVKAEGPGHRRLGLPGVGRDDFQVRLGAEREQCVAGAQADVLASCPGPDAEALLCLGDGRGQVWGGVDQVVNQHLIPIRSRRHGLTRDPGRLQQAHCNRG
jgi:hypothetical protein